METLHRNKSKDAIIHCVFIDFLSNQSVRAGAVAIHKFTHRLDFLILNAGIAKGPPAEIFTLTLYYHFSSMKLSSILFTN
mmetsp:Transcript_24489/g.37256  ORF Transcript_24489/g.37256 Transcript_24489/m.37256 type:complete len:80 (+) Transcript_24489:574-813(+)